MYGLPFKPDEFMQQALRAGHPRTFQAPLPEALQVAVELNVSLDSRQLASRRAEWLAKWAAVAKDMVPEEVRLKQSMAPHVKCLLAGKRLAMWKKMLTSS